MVERGLDLRTCVHSPSAHGFQPGTGGVRQPTRQWETHREGLLDKPECPVDICGLEFKVKPMNLIAEMSLEKFSCRVQVWGRRWVDLNRKRVSQVSVAKGDTAGDLRLFERQMLSWSTMTCRLGVGKDND